VVELGTNELHKFIKIQFLRATALTPIALFSHRNSLCPSVGPSVTWVDQAETHFPRANCTEITTDRP